MCAHSLSLSRYVIYPIQVLAKSCKPVPVMLMGAAMGKVYPARKYANVVMIVLGVALFMGAGTDKKNSHASASDGDDADSDSDNESNGSPSQIIGIVLLFVSLCFDGGTGAYEDKLMSVHSVQPFDLMYNIQLGKTILAFIGLLVLNQLHIFIQMVQEMGFLLVALGLSGALGQVFIFVTIAKFGALTCSIIGLARKVTTLVASIYFYGHHLNSLQFTGLMISVTAMVLNFLGKKGGGGEHGDGHGHGGAQPTTQNMPEEMQKMLDDEAHDDDDDNDDDDSGGDVELAASPKELV
jgi:UDP-galactose transporter B1